MKTLKAYFYTGKHRKPESDPLPREFWMRWR